jgi:single-stranded-DNA-specific exonuclease
LIGHGGHAAAAGLKIAEANVEAFRAEFCEHAAAGITDADRDGELLIDAETPLSALTMQTVNQIERLAPFGAGNARPTLSTTGVSLVEPPKRIGNGHHLSLRLRQHGISLRGVAFGQGDWAEPMAANGHELVIAYRPVINHFRGRHSVELHLTDWRPAGSANPAVSAPRQPL